MAKFPLILGLVLATSCLHCLVWILHIVNINTCLFRWWGVRHHRWECAQTGKFLDPEAFLQRTSSLTSSLTPSLAYTSLVCPVTPAAQHQLGSAVPSFLDLLSCLNKIISLRFLHEYYCGKSICLIYICIYICIYNIHSDLYVYKYIYEYISH